MRTIRVRTNYAGSQHITAGKVYEGKSSYEVEDEYGIRFRITNDNGDSIFCLQNGCAYIDYGEWEILPEGPSVADEMAEALRVAIDALHEATAILGGEYGDHYQPLCDKMASLESSGESLLTKHKESKQ